MWRIDSSAISITRCARKALIFERETDLHEQRDFPLQHARL